MNSVFITELPIPRYQLPVQNLAISWNISAGALENSALKSTTGGLKKIKVGLLIAEKRINLELDMDCLLKTIILHI